MEQVKANPLYNLVKVLNDGGLQIIEIDGEYFSVDDFRPADKNTPYHIVKGKHITDMMGTHLGTGLQGQLLEGFLQKVNALPSRYVQYSEGTPWKQMIS